MPVRYLDVDFQKDSCTYKDFKRAEQKYNEEKKVNANNFYSRQMKMQFTMVEEKSDEDDLDYLYGSKGSTDVENKKASTSTTSSVPVYRVYSFY